MKKRNVFNLVGIVISVAAIIVGIIIIFSPAESYSTKSVDYAAFGGDYYTEEYAATRAAVGNTAVTANNIRELGGKLALYVGLMFVFGGAYAGVLFTKWFFDEKEALQTVEVKEISAEERDLSESRIPDAEKASTEQ